MGFRTDDPAAFYHPLLNTYQDVFVFKNECTVRIT